MANIYTDGALAHAVIAELEKRAFFLRDYGYSVYLLACAGLNEEPINGLNAIAILKELEKTFCPRAIGGGNGDALLISIQKNRSTVAPDIIKYLVREIGFDVNHVYDKDRGASALHYAIGSGRLDVVERLISLGANVRVCSDYRHPIGMVHYMCKDDAIIYALLTAGAVVPDGVVPKSFQQYIEDLRAEVDRLNKKYEDEFAPDGLGAKHAAEHFSELAKRQKNE
jgi:hypothetical protein